MVSKQQKNPDIAKCPNKTGSMERKQNHPGLLKCTSKLLLLWKKKSMDFIITRKCWINFNLWSPRQYLEEDQGQSMDKVGTNIRDWSPRPENRTVWPWDKHKSVVMESQTTRPKVEGKDLPLIAVPRNREAGGFREGITAEVEPWCHSLTYSQSIHWWQDLWSVPGT